MVYRLFTINSILISLLMTLSAAVNVRAGGSAAQPGHSAVYHVRPWQALSHKTMSRTARRVFRPLRGRWIHAEAEHLLVHGTTFSDVHNAATLGVFTLNKLAALFPPLPDGVQTRILIVRDPRQWQRITGGSHLRSDTIGVHAGREILLRRDDSHAVTRLDLPHELVHFYLAQVMDPLPPLWVEEGLAGHLAWTIAAHHAEENGLLLTRTVPPLSAEHLFTVEQLTSMTSYPTPQEVVQAFYAQSEKLIAGIIDLIGRDELFKYIVAVAKNNETWDDVLRQTYRVDEQALGRLIQAVEQPDGQ